MFFPDDISKLSLKVNRGLVDIWTPDPELQRTTPYHWATSLIHRERNYIWRSWHKVKSMRNLPGLVFGQGPLTPPLSSVLGPGSLRYQWNHWKACRVEPLWSRRRHPQLPNRCSELQRVLVWCHSMLRQQRSGARNLPEILPIYVCVLFLMFRASSTSYCSGVI